MVVVGCQTAKITIQISSTAILHQKCFFFYNKSNALTKWSC